MMSSPVLSRRPTERKISPGDWLHQSPAFLIDGYWPPLFPRIEYNAVELLGRAQELGCSVVRFPCVGKWATYPSAIMPVHPDLGERDLVAETIREAKRRGMRVALYLAVGHALPRTLVQDMRPAWGAKLDDGTWPEPRQFFGGEGVVPIDTFGQYWHDLLFMVDELLSRYEIDALYLDGPYYGWHFWEGLISQTEATRRAFESETGRPLPANGDTANPHRDAFWAWAAERLRLLFCEIRAKALAQGNIPILFNLCAGQVGSVNMAADFIALSEGCLLERIMGGIDGFAKSRRAGCFVWQYASHHTYWPRFSSTTYEKKVSFDAAETVRNGGRPIYANAGRFAYQWPLRPDIIASYQTIAALSARLAPAVKASHCHILIGDGPFDHLTGDGRQRALTGLLDALESNAIGAEIRLADTFAAPPPVLMLPSVFDPSLWPMALLSRYVRNGGLLIAFLGQSEHSISSDLCSLLSLKTLVPSQESKLKLNLHRFEDFAGVAGDISRLQNGWHGYDLYLRETGQKALLPLGIVPSVQPVGEVEDLAWMVSGTQGENLSPVIWKRRLERGAVITVASDVDYLCGLTGDTMIYDLVSGLVRNHRRPSPSIEFRGMEKEGLRASIYRDATEWSIVVADLTSEGTAFRDLPELEVVFPADIRISKIETTPASANLKVVMTHDGVRISGGQFKGHLGVHLQIENL